MRKVLIKRFTLSKGYSGSGVVYRAFLEDDTPLYLGAETKEGLKQRVQVEFSPDVTFEDVE